jgi:multisubunit Na+/H+ antiporter MnhB subunit
MSLRNAAAVVFFIIVAIFLIFGALLTHPFGEPEFRDKVIDPETNEVIEILRTPEMDDYIIDNCQNETGADNGVTSVVFDYRGFDTLGEATVLFTAVAGVIVLFRRLKK